MIFMPISVGILIGNPIAGAISKDGSAGLQAFCGAVMLCATFLEIAVRFAKAGPSFLIRV